MQNEQDFIEAMIGEGLNPMVGEYAGRELLEAAQLFARHMGYEVDGEGESGRRGSHGAM